jgi:DNA polymerase V
MIRNIQPVRSIELEPLENPGEVSGFKSPAADYEEQRLNIMQRLVKDPTNTYYWESENNDMILFGMKKGTLSIIDTTIIPKGGMIVVAWHEGKFYVRQLLVRGREMFLTTGLEHGEIIRLNETSLIKGVVTWSCCPQLELKRHDSSRRL